MIVGFFGMGGHSFQADQFRDELAQNGIKLLTCHEYPNADVPYDYRKIHSFIDNCDVIILPSRYQVQPAKGVNKLAIAWSRKKAVVCSPMPSYMEFVKHGENALAANNNAEFVEHLKNLAKDPQRRTLLAEKGYETAVKYFSPVDHITHFFEALNNTDNPLVTIIIPHYSDRTDYLKLAVESVLASSYQNINVIVVSSSQNADLSVLPKSDRLTVIHNKPTNGIYQITAVGNNGQRYSEEKKEQKEQKEQNENFLTIDGVPVKLDHGFLYKYDYRLTFSQANNTGIKNARENIEYFLLLNDDTIIGKDCIQHLIDAAVQTKNEAIINAFSNCDKGWLHNNKIEVDNLELVPNMTYEQIHGRFDKIRNTEIRVNSQQFVHKQTELYPTNFCAMYCTLIPKQILEKVGELSEEYLNGGEDADYSYRAKRLGFNTFWTNAWCFHFGGKTRKFSEDQDRNRHHQEDDHNNSLLHKKWGRGEKKRVAIWTGPSWAHDSGWDLDTYKTVGCGGSETCAIRLAMEFAKEGHYVIMYGSHPKKVQYGVQLCPWEEFRPEQEYFDLFIASRNLNCIDQRLRAKTILAWIHDVGLLSGKEISDYHMNRVTKFIALSPWHKQFIMDYHSIPEDKIEIIPNGVNVEFFKI